MRDLLGPSNVEEWDRGLPVYLFESDTPLPKQRWMRRSDPRAFGKYRHTYAFVHHGRLERPSFAKFVATLPNTGSWRLDYFMPVEALGPNDREAHILLVQGKRVDWYDKFKPGTTKINVLIGGRERDVSSSMLSMQILAGILSVYLISILRTRKFGSRAHQTAKQFMRMLFVGYRLTIIELVRQFEATGTKSIHLPAMIHTSLKRNLLGLAGFLLLFGIPVLAVGQAENSITPSEVFTYVEADRIGNVHDMVELNDGVIAVTGDYGVAYFDAQYNITAKKKFGDFFRNVSFVQVPERDLVSRAL